MADSTKKAPKASRQKLLSQAREWYPDRKFTDLDAAPEEDAADLDDAIDEKLTELLGKQAKYDENNAKLAKLLRTEPIAAEFMQTWVDTGDPLSAIVELFGDDLGMNEESRSQFKGKLDSWRERKQKNDSINAEFETNYGASLQALEDWGNAKGLSLEEKRDVMVRLIDIAMRGTFGQYTPDDFDMAYKALHHDADVTQARKEGEVTGRNEKIAVARRDRNAAGSMPPAPVGRNGGRLGEPTPKPKSLWEEVNNG